MTRGGSGVTGAEGADLRVWGSVPHRASCSALVEVGGPARAEGSELWAGAALVQRALSKAAGLGLSPAHWAPLPPEHMCCLEGWVIPATPV